MLMQILWNLKWKSRNPKEIWNVFICLNKKKIF